MVDLMFILPVGMVLIMRVLKPLEWFHPVFFLILCLSSVSHVCIETNSFNCRRWGTLLRAEAVLLCIALHIPFTIQHSVQFWGMRPERVVSISGILEDDGVPVENGRTRFLLRAELVEDAFGNRARADGSVLITAGGSTSVIPKGLSDKRGSPLCPAIHAGNCAPASLYRGGRIRVPASLYRISEGEQTWYGSSGSGVEIIENPSGVCRIRGVLSEFLRNRLRSIGRHASPLFEALLLGYRDIRAGELFELFRECGTVHLLALSGMHLGVITLGVLCVLIPIAGRTRASCAALFVVICYLCLVGPRPSIIRAVLMFGTGVWGYVMNGKRPRLMHLLAVTFYTQAVIYPLSIQALGFQLSYMALGGILLFSGIVEKIFPYRIPPVFRAALSASVCAMLCTAGILVKYFGVLYPAGLIASMVLTPLIVAWMWAGLIYIFWSLIGLGSCSPLFLSADLQVRKLIDAAAEQFLRLTAYFSRLPSLRIPPDMWPFTAGVSLAVLTLVVLSQYAGRYGANRKLQLSERDIPVFKDQRDGSKPPVWAEFPHFTGSEGEDHRAA